MMPKPGRARSISASVLALALLLFLQGCAAHSNIAAPPAGIAAVAGEDGPAEVASTEVEFHETPFTEGKPAQDQETVADPLDLVAEALELCESARIFWEEGDIDEALTTLDYAYAMMLEIPRDTPELDQQKEDLRHLISQRVVEIYRSRLTSAVDLGSTIPLDLNAQLVEARRQQEEAEAAASESWDTLQNGARESYATLRTAIEEAAARLRQD